MRRIVTLGAALALMTANVVVADEQADMKALIERAIKAQGGEEKITKFKAETFKGKGKFYGNGEGADYTGEWAVQIPDKIRVQIDAEAGNMKFTFIRVVNGDKVWQKFADMTMEVTDKDQLAEAKEESYARWAGTLVPLMGKGFQLASLGEIKVDGKPAVGVRVSHKGHRDINLFFDKDKGLLVRSENIVKDPMAGDKEMTQETLFSNYKEINGVLHPMKVVINRDGKKYVDAEITEMELKESLDDSVFGKP
jgi:outer membrane lipoprotein-sorting protein